MGKGCIYHILGHCQNEFYHSIEEFKNTLCKELGAISEKIIVMESKESKYFKTYSIVFYFDNISKEDLEVKLHEKFNVLKLALMGESEIIEI